MRRFGIRLVRASDDRRGERDGADERDRHGGRHAGGPPRDRCHRQRRPARAHRGAIVGDDRGPTVAVARRGEERRLRLGGGGGHDTSPAPATRRRGRRTPRQRGTDRVRCRRDVSARPAPRRAQPRRRGRTTTTAADCVSPSVAPITPAAFTSPKPRPAGATRCTKSSGSPHAAAPNPPPVTAVVLPCSVRTAAAIAVGRRARTTNASGNWRHILSTPAAIENPEHADSGGDTRRNDRTRSPTPTTTGTIDMVATPTSRDLRPTLSLSAARREKRKRNFARNVTSRRRPLGSDA